jgi:pimeloyl-ACP methyl ester carboxylesterase
MSGVVKVESRAAACRLPSPVWLTVKPMSTPPPYLVAAGRRLEYRWIPAARRDAPPLVFLHEGLGSAALWGDFPDRLAATTGSGALIYSRYGFGRSEPLREPRTPDYLEREALDALPAVLEGRGIERPVLIGHSDGATIALIHAAAGRWPVRGLVLEAPHVFVEDVTIRGIERARAEYDAGRLRGKLQPCHENVDATFRGWADLWLLPEFRDWNIERTLAGIHCPVLVIQGEEDRYGTAAQLEAIERRASGPVETMMLASCGHAPHAEQPEVVLAAMARFIGAQSRAA